MTDIVILSIGPVQSYISAARRTQDLRAASDILSLFSKEACAEAVRLQCDIVYPKTASSATNGVPNRIVFVTPTTGQGKSIAPDVCRQIEQKRDNLSNLVKNFFNSHLQNATFNTALWDVQVKDWLELYWVVVPWDENPATYQASLHLASLALDGRKGLRSYPTADEGTECCTLCGIRSSLGGKAFWEHFHVTGFSHLIREQEHLCAVCTIKRLLPMMSGSPIHSAGFPSTAGIASISYRQEIRQNWENVQPQMNTLLSAMRSVQLTIPSQTNIPQDFCRIEGAYFYRDFYTVPSVEQETGFTASSNQLKAAKDALSELSRSLASAGCTFTHPSAYYAILLIDGDHMGRLLDSVGDKSKHSQISNTLAGLAVSSASIIQQNHGWVVYSGGDDLLALLPVDTALTAAYQIQDEFGRQLTNIGFPGQTMSAGIAIAHYNEPLQNAIRAASEAEHEAKNTYDRNTLVIHLAKRSGEFRKAALKWKSTGGNPFPIPILNILIQSIAKGDLSGKFAYELWDEIPSLRDSAQNPSASWFSLEVFRLLKRHAKKGWKTEPQLKQMADQVLSLWNFIPFETPSKVEEIVQWLLLSRFLAQGEQE